MELALFFDSWMPHFFVLEPNVSPWMGCSQSWKLLEYLGWWRSCVCLYVPCLSACF